MKKIDGTVNEKPIVLQNISLRKLTIDNPEVTVR